MYITIVCLSKGCNKVFKRKANGITLRYYEKNNSIIDSKGNKQNCPKCGGLKVKFKDYL